MKEFFGVEMPKLGFGMMRLPKLESGEFDYEQINTMVDCFLDAGLKYFDTAYVYEGSEDTVKKTLVDRHPRESYYLTSKINASKWAVQTKEECLEELEISLERTGAGYFDFYLLHALGKDNEKLYDEYEVWDFVKEAKEKGLIKHYGFSFHDSAEFLDELLTKHPDIEIVQLQINYADWNSPSIQSGDCYEVCVKHNKPVIVMEPVRGGVLANPPEAIKEAFVNTNPDVSFASWAIRYAASLENVMVVLSGMSTIEQVEDNVGYMKNFTPLDEKENETIQKVQEIFASIEQIPCTGCKYCVKGCPMNINIPGIFSSMNHELIFAQADRAKRNYEANIKDAGKASDCIKCLQCEGACPQHIEITSWLEKAAEKYE